MNNNLALDSAILADRHHGVSEGMRALLETMFTTVVMVANENSLRESVERLEPTVVIVDLSLFHTDNTKWLSSLKAICPQMQLIVLSEYDQSCVRSAILEAGADGFVVKRNIATDLLPVIESAMKHAGRAELSITETEDWHRNKQEREET